MAKPGGIPAGKRSSSRFLARVTPGARPVDSAVFVPPCLPNRRKAPPKGDGWVHEIMFEGLRLEAVVQEGRAALHGKDGSDQTLRFPRLASALARLPVNRIVLDGIALVQDSAGRSDPEALDRDLAAGRQERIVYYAVDLLHLDGFDLTAAPLADRKRVLAALIAEAGEGPIAFSEHLAVDGAAMLERAKAMGLAGIVSKLEGSPYESGRSKSWVEVALASRPAKTPAEPRRRETPTVSSEGPVRPLLVIDGDSFAHRAYHALPKTIRRAGNRGAGAIVGFANYLIRFHTAEEPRAVLVAWDTLDQPNWRQKLFPAYQGGRVFDAALLDQLDVLPELVRACGFATAKAAGYEADDFLAAAVAFEEGRGGKAVVASGDRDAFQLASESTVIVHPLRAGEMARIGPAEVRERYGVDPKQVPDFIALRGDPSDKIPGARGVGAGTAASLLSRYASLEEALAEGRFSSQVNDLRLYRRIATMDASAPLPPLPDQTPTWDKGAALARDWALSGLAERLAGLAGGAPVPTGGAPRRARS